MLRKLGAVWLAMAGIGACHIVANVDEIEPNPPCEDDAKCNEDQPPACQVGICKAGLCELIARPDGEECSTPTACADWKCREGVCEMFPSPAALACDYGFCDGAGECVCPARNCPNGAPCTYHADCASGNCVNSHCEPSPCGGPCPGVCWVCIEQDATACTPLEAEDTAGGLCPNGCDGAGECRTCDNGTQDEGETDSDCGGLSCPPCKDGESCQVAADCANCICDAGTCEPPRCGNGLQDGCEADVDCGGVCGPTCANGERCGGKQDCASHYCANGVCGEAPG